MSALDAAAASRRLVRAAYPDARLVPDGIMYAITAGGRFISHRKVTPTQAWISAAEIVRENRP